MKLILAYLSIIFIKHKFKNLLSQSFLLADDKGIGHSRRFHSIDIEVSGESFHNLLIMTSRFRFRLNRVRSAVLLVVVMENRSSVSRLSLSVADGDPVRNNDISFVIHKVGDSKGFLEQLNSSAAEFDRLRGDLHDGIFSARRSGERSLVSVEREGLHNGHISAISRV